MLPTLPRGYANDISQEEVRQFFHLIAEADSQDTSEKETDPQDSALSYFESMLDTQMTLGMAPGWQMQDTEVTSILDESGDAMELLHDYGGESQLQPSFGCNYLYFRYWFTRSRRYLHSVVVWQPFDNFILFVICLSSVALALENPYNTDTEKLLLGVGDWVWLVVFTIEGIMKISALGPEKYWADEWNKLDVLVLFFTYITMFGPKDSGAGILRLFRIGRTLRPLRMINKNPEMKAIVNSIMSSLPAVTNALILACFAFFVFAVFGLNSFMGQLFTCNEGDLHSIDCHGSKVMETEGGDEFMMPVVWSNRRNNFDNIFTSLLTLYEAATTEGWVDLMYATMDIAGEGKAPIFNNHIENSLYWVLFIFICTFFIVQLFVGVIIDNYNREMNVLTESQKRWVMLKRLMMNLGPDPLCRPKEYWRLIIYKLVRTEAFDITVTVLVVINVMFIASTHYGQSDAWTEMLENVNLFFVAAFSFEMILKLIAFGPVQYINDAWNIFDGFIVLGSIMMLFFSGGTIASIGRAFRIVRLMKIVKRAKGLKTLFNTMLTSLPSMCNISLLMFLLYFVYAVIGTTLFGLTKYGDNYTKVTTRLAHHRIILPHSHTWITNTWITNAHRCTSIFLPVPSIS